MHVTLQQLGGPIGLTAYIGALALAGFLLTVRGLPWWYQLLMGAAAALAVAGMWLTCLADPGVIPAAHEPDPLVQQLDAGVPVADSYVYSRDSRGAWTRRSMHSRSGGCSKYCSTCHIWRPPRSHHCSSCNACMEHWDHHCGVVGNCIAGRNHRFFAGFLLCGQLGCLLNLGGAIWRLRQRGVPTAGAWMGTESFLLIVAAVVYGYTATMLLFGTLHCLALVCDITTKDVLTDKQLWRNPPCCPGDRSPANLVRSWKTLCCLPTTCRPWEQQQLLQEQQQQQQAEHAWRRLSVMEEADVPDGTGSRDGSSCDVGLQPIDVEVAASPGTTLLHRQQPQQLRCGNTS